MKVVIIEDEAPAAARLQRMLASSPVDIEVIRVLDTVAGASVWLQANPLPDLMLMDIQLSDGLSLELAKIGCPVIFITAHDQYWQAAFEYNSIDYLLKPVTQERLDTALQKFGELRSYFAKRYGELEQYHRDTNGQIGGMLRAGYRDKFLVRRGSEYVSVAVRDIAFFFASHKMVCMVRRDGAKFILDHSVADIEKQVDPADWYRVNRKYLVHRQAIRRMTVLPKSKLQLILEPAAREELIVSSEGSAGFKKWMGK